MNNKAYEAHAMNWINNGRPDSLLMTDLPLAALRCWLGTHRYIKTPDISPVIDEYLAACEAKLPQDWYDKIMWRKSSCSSCGETYKIENLRICTQCHDLYCYSCAGQIGKDEFGFQICRCGGELTG